MRTPLRIVGSQPEPRRAAEPVAPVESVESRLFRKLQRVISALSAEEPPTYRERSELRAAARQAVDAYVTDKLAERAERASRG